jgi:hypothetical protein
MKPSGIATACLTPRWNVRSTSGSTNETRGGPFAKRGETPGAVSPMDPSPFNPWSTRRPRRAMASGRDGWSREAEGIAGRPEGIAARPDGVAGKREGIAGGAEGFTASGTLSRENRTTPRLNCVSRMDKREFIARDRDLPSWKSKPVRGDRDLPTWNRDLPMWKSKPVRGDRDLPTWNRDLPPWKSKPVRGDRDLPAWNRDLPAWKSKPARGDRDLPAWNRDLSTWNRDPSTWNRGPMSRGSRETTEEVHPRARGVSENLCN